VSRPHPQRTRRRARGLRFRVTAGFALGSLALVAVLAGVTYLVSEHYLVRQRERSLIRQAYVDARVVRFELQRGDVTEALKGLDLAPGSNVAVALGERWFGTSVAAGEANIPADLRRKVAEGTPAHQRVREGSGLRLVVGIPLEAAGVEYYEVFALSELDRTLRVIRTALVAGGLLAIALGGLLGFWMSRRVLKPVTDFAAAAQQVTAGNLRTRLAPDHDPDLDSLAVSFNEMVDSLEQRIDRETRFVADVSHELRSPVTTLSTASQLLAARRDELPVRARQAFDLLETEIARLAQLVEDLLELGRADAGVAELDLGAVELDEFVHRAVEPMQRNGGTVSIADNLNGSRVMIDKRRLERVLVNLLANAETHGQGLESVVVTRRDDILRIEVVDSGPGVRPSEREAVFDRFYRGAVAGRRASGSGSGLGLSLVAEQVSLHGGRVWVEEVVSSGGARFVVELPWRSP
jgi:two-component system sensor histidine kinase MtrB